MKKLKLFFALFAMLALGVGNAWGAEASFTIKFKDNGSDASTALTTATFTKQVAEGTDLIKSVSTSYCYAGTGGLKCSSNKNNGTFTLALNNSYTISKIVLSVKNKNATTKTVKVGSTSFSTSDSWNTTSFEDLAFTGTETTSDQITVSLAGTTKSKRVAYIASMTVYYKTDESGTEEPSLSVEPKEVAFGTKNIYFDSEKKGELEIDITGQNLTGDVSAAISGADASVFALSKTTFTPNSGEVSDKLTVSYDVSEYSEVKNYTATLTLSSDGVDDIELPITLTTVNKKPTIYTKVTDATTLSAGDKVILVYESAKKAAGKISNTNGGYLNAIDITQALNTTANPATVSITDEAVVEYTLDGTAGAWELISTSGKLSEASANSSGSVDLALDKVTKWTISISSGNATIKGTTNTIKYNTSSPRFKTYSSGQTAIQLYAISVPKYAVNFTQPEGGELSVKNGETAITSGNTFAEGIKLTVTATPANGYEGGTVVVKDADDNDVTATVYADGVLTMPAYAVTISATFEEKECTLLTTPVVTATPTYNSATLTWAAVADAAKYSVKVGTADAVETTETSYEVTGLNAETTYTYQVKAIAEADQDTYCDSEVAEGTFTTTAAPAAKLILKDIVGETTKTGALNGTITLPTTAAECSKTFVGWDADENCDHAPTYAPGAEYTFTTQDPTLYAVYADGESGEASLTKMTSSDALANGDKIVIVANGTKLGMYQETISTSYVKNWELGAEEPTISELDEKKIWDVVAVDGSWKLGDATNGYLYNSSSNNLAVSSAEASTWTIAWKTTGFTFKSNQNRYLACRTDLTTDKKNLYRMNGTSVNSTNGSAYEMDIYKYSVSAPTYSNYSTTCAAALAAPTFSVAEGTCTEAKSIELSAAEGDIYYTLDGTEPTESNTPYTAAINLDECGTTTIKAIAISTERKSPVASATYTINLPITNTAATAYTPTEATAIIDGACDKSEEVYVKGVVVSTSEFNATYGNYDVIVKAVDDNSATPKTFTFYRMYKAASNTKFTESDEVIGVGDIITAKGVLKKYNSTYELAEGCYMVERVPFTEPKTDISNTLETAYTVDKAFELISDIKSDLDKEVYVKGLVAVASTELYEEKYLTYSISDNGQTTGNVLKIYDGLDIGGVAFASKDDVKVGDYIVVKGKLLNYKGTYELNKGNQLVQHKKAATITIADITMEVGETKTIAATITPAAAKTEVAYSIKENATNAISLSGNVITANTVGSATITATIATAADYMGKTVEFEVTVTPKTEKTDVVILAELGGKWYAMKGAVPSGKSNQLDALEVTYFNGTLYNVAESDKASITWTRSVVDGKATFVNNGKYLKGDTDTDLTLSASVDDNCKWMWNDENGYYTTNTSGTIRTFLCRENYNFKNYGVSQAGKEDANGDYSALPVVTAPVYATGDIVYTRDVTPGNYGTICLPYASDNFTGATFFEVAGKEGDKVFFDEVTTLEAGKPYIFMAEATEIKVVQIGEAAIEAGNHNSLQGTFTQINPAVDNVLVDNYMIVNNVIKKCGVNCGLQAYRAYFIADDLKNLRTPLALAPGARRVSMGVAGQNTATGVDQVEGDNVPTKMIINGQLFILRGEKMYDAQGKLVK